MGFFSRRKQKESAIPEATESQALGSFANPDGQAVVGQQVGGGGTPGLNVQGMDLGDTFAMLSQIGPMIQQAMASGNVQISQGAPQVINARGTELGEQIKEIMRQHGIDPESGQVNAQADAGSYMQMQQQILETLSQHGIDANAPGSINFTNVQIEGEGELPGGTSGS